MAITTYAELQTAFTDRIARADFTSGQIQECIALAESEMQRALRTLDMETKSTSITINAEYVNVPADFLQVVDFYMTGTNTQYGLRWMPPETMTDAFRSTTGNSDPRFYSVIGGQFRFAPVPPTTASYTTMLVYFAKIPALSGSQTTNWLLTAHPDAYLYGSLKHGAARLKDPQSAAYYDGLFQAALFAVQSATDRNRDSGPGLTMRPG